MRGPLPRRDARSTLAELRHLTTVHVRASLLPSPPCRAWRTSRWRWRSCSCGTAQPTRCPSREEHRSGWAGRWAGCWAGDPAPGAPATRPGVAAVVGGVDRDHRGRHRGRLRGPLPHRRLAPAADRLDRGQRLAARDLRAGVRPDHGGWLRRVAHPRPAHSVGSKPRSPLAAIGSPTTSTHDWSRWAGPSPQPRSSATVLSHRWAQ